MTITRVYYVQDKDTGDFLAPDSAGDCCFVKLLRNAVPFDDYECAVDTAIIHLGSDYAITSIIVDVDSLSLN